MDQLGVHEAVVDGHTDQGILPPAVGAFDELDPVGQGQSDPLAAFEPQFEIGMADLIGTPIQIPIGPQATPLYQSKGAADRAGVAFQGVDKGIVAGHSDYPRYRCRGLRTSTLNERSTSNEGDGTPSVKPGLEGLSASTDTADKVPSRRGDERRGRTRSGHLGMTPGG